MVIELDEQKVENALYSIEQQTRFMLCVQVLCVIAVLTIIGFHSKVSSNGSLQMAINMPLFPCVTTTLLAVMSIYYQVKRAGLNHIRIKIICSYLKDGAIIFDE